MPNSEVFLNIRDHEVQIELRLPAPELELAFGQSLAGDLTYVKRDYGSQLCNYILNHIHFRNSEGSVWNCEIKSLEVETIATELNGNYNEIIVRLTAFGSGSPRHFVMDYDIIVHQVVTHFAVISIGQDFNNGITPDHPLEVGVIQLDRASNKIFPFTVNLNEGSWRKGFTNMVKLGMKHIGEGTDHLLFLLVILLIATLQAMNKKWGKGEGVKFTLIRFTKITLSFTIGHSITLLLVAFTSWSSFSIIIEVLIAFSILLSAVHTLRPIFYSKEFIVTFAFGLLHGAAFAFSLQDFNLDSTQLALSVLAFNIGIELMQLLVLLCFLPVLFLSKYRIYSWLRITLGNFAIIASLSWIVERIAQQPNTISGYFSKLIIPLF